MNRASVLAKLALASLSLAAFAADPSAANAATPSSLAVYHVDDMIMTQIAIRPSQLLHYPGVHRHVTTNPATIAAALKALHAALPSSNGVSRNGFDARWALVFTYPSGRKETIYTDTFTTQAQIDGTPQTFTNGGPLKKFLWAKFGPP